MILSIFGALAAIIIIIITAIVTLVVGGVVYIRFYKKPRSSTSKGNSIQVNPNPTYHHSSHIVSVEENVINNTKLCVRQPLDVRMEDNNQEGNEQQNYAMISHERIQPTKEGRTESDYISHSFALANSQLNSSPQQVSLFPMNEELNNRECVV